MIFFKKELKNLNSKVFIDSGFIESQILWVLPIIDGYCSKLGLKKIVFQKELSSKLKTNSFVKDFLTKYEIEYLEKKKFKILYKIFVLFLSTIIFPYYFLVLTRKTILKEKNWFKSQVYHALWDTSLSLGKDGDLKPSLINLFKSSYLINYNFILVLQLKSKYSIHSSFLSHSVYQGRIFLAMLRKSSNVFCQSAFNFYRQPENFDESWSILKDEKNLNRILRKISDEDVEKYWNKRLSGRGKVYESNLINKFDNKNLEKDINVIMLHVFRDSSFNFIDKERIFCDYIDWIYNTIKILKNSNEKWYIRPHPFSYRWGEESIKFIDKIKENLGVNKSNFDYLDNNISNNLIFEKAKKLLTYSGTAFIEFASYGKKAIIISDVIPKFYQEQISIKPKSLKEYENLINNEINLNEFNLKNDKAKLSQKLIFSRENVTNLAGDTGGYFVYRNDGEEIKDQEYKSVEIKLGENLNYFNQLGSKFLSKNFTHSISSNYINKIEF